MTLTPAEEIAAANREKRPPWGKTNCDLCGLSLWPGSPTRPAMVGPKAAFCFDCFILVAISRSRPLHICEVVSSERTGRVA